MDGSGSGEIEMERRTVTSEKERGKGKRHGVTGEVRQTIGQGGRRGTKKKS